MDWSPDQSIARPQVSSLETSTIGKLRRSSGCWHQTASRLTNRRDIFTLHALPTLPQTLSAPAGGPDHDHTEAAPLGHIHDLFLRGPPEYGQPVLAGANPITR